MGMLFKKRIDIDGDPMQLARNQRQIVLPQKHLYQQSCFGGSCLSQTCFIIIVFGLAGVL